MSIFLAPCGCEYRRERDGSLRRLTFETMWLCAEHAWMTRDESARAEHMGKLRDAYAQLEVVEGPR